MNTTVPTTLSKSQQQQLKFLEDYETANQRAFDINKSFVSGMADLTNPTFSMSEIIKNSAKAITETDSLRFLDEQATKIQNAFGVGKQRLSEFKTLIADTTPELVKMGFSQEESTQAVIDITKSLGTNASVGKEAVVELSAVSRLTGEDITTLASSFRDVGVSIYESHNVRLVVQSNAQYNYMLR